MRQYFRLCNHTNLQDEYKYQQNVKCWNAVIEIERVEYNVDEVVQWFFSEYSADVLWLTNEHYDWKKKIWLCIYPDDNQYNIEFSSETINLLYKNHIDIGVNITNLQEFYKG